MTKKEAINVLRKESVEIGGNAVSVARWLTALDAVVKALEEVPDKDVGKNEPLTNAQKIRAMTDDELNELFHEIYNAGAEDAVSYVWGNRTNNFEWTMEWLQQPAEEDDENGV